MTGLAAVLAAALLFAHSNAGPLPSNVTLTSTALPGDDCAGVQCAPRAGCKALHRPDACCPLYQCECELDGRVYGNGEKLVDPGDPCRVCYCQGGEVVCRRIACFRRDDCRPRAVPGRCCPEYDNCPITGGSAMVAAVEDASSAAPSSAAPPPPPRETPKQEITIKEITPVSEIPSFSDAKPKEPAGMLAASRAPIIVREATAPTDASSSASPQPTLSTGMSNAYELSPETSKSTPDDELLDHNPAFPPIPDDLTHRDDDMLPEQVAEPEPEPTTSARPSESPSTIPSTSTILTTHGTPETVATTAPTALKASPMLNLRSAIPTAILNLPSSVHEDINGELDDITEGTMSPGASTSNEIPKEIKTHPSDLTPLAPVTVTLGTETPINTKRQTGTSPDSTTYLSTDRTSTVLVSRTSTERVSSYKPSTNQPSTAKATTDRPSTNFVTTDEPKTDQIITDRVITERSHTDRVNVLPNTERASTDRPSTVKASTYQPTTIRVSSTKWSNTVHVSTNDPTADKINTERPKADQESTRPPNVEGIITDRSSNDQPSTTQVILNTDLVTNDDTKTERTITTLPVNVESKTERAITNMPTDTTVTSRPSSEEKSIKRAGSDFVSTDRSSIGHPSADKSSIDQSKNNTDWSDTKPPSTEQPTTTRMTSDDRATTIQLDVDAPATARNAIVGKTELSSIAIETSDRKPQDTVKNADMIDVSFSPVSDRTADETGVSEMTTVFKGVPSNIEGLIFDKDTTDDAVTGASTAAQTVSVSKAEGAGAGVLGELIDLVGDVAAIGDREPAGPVSDQHPVNAGYKSRHRPSANSIDDQPARRRSPELEEDGEPLPEPTPPSRAEPTTRLPPIDGDGARPPAPPPPPAPQDIEIITSSYVPTISRRPTKLVEFAATAE